MKNLRFLASALLFSLLSIAVLSGCGDDGGNNGNSCNSSQDCIKPGVKTSQVCANLTQKDTSGKYIGGGMCYNSCQGTGNEATGEPKKDTSLCDAKSACVYFGDLSSSDPKVRKTWNPTCIPKCNKDSDCGNHDLTCVTYDGQNVCIAKQCKNDSECDQSKGQTCGKTSGICQAKTSGSIKPVTAKQCTSSDTSKCSATNPQLFACVSDKCEARPLVAVVIKDATTDPKDARCKVGDAGSDITGVSISSADGTVKGWLASTYSPDHYSSVKKPDATYTHVSQPDGSAPKKLSSNTECLGDSLTGSSADRAKNWTSLGCGGAIAMATVGKGSTAAALKETKKTTITVYEYDQKQCQGPENTPPSSDSDAYDVYGCVESDNLLDQAGLDKDIADGLCVKLNKAPLKGYGQVEWDPSTF